VAFGDLGRERGGKCLPGVRKRCCIGCLLRATQLSMADPIGEPLGGHHDRRQDREQQIFGTSHHGREYDAGREGREGGDKRHPRRGTVDWFGRERHADPRCVRVGSVESRRPVEGKSAIDACCDRDRWFAGDCQQQRRLADAKSSSDAYRHRVAADTLAVEVGAVGRARVGDADAVDLHDDGRVIAGHVGVVQP
jgi:hypothetical protein